MPLRDGDGTRTQRYSDEIFRHMNINFFHRTKYYSGVPFLFMFPRYNIPVRYNTVPQAARQYSLRLICEYKTVSCQLYDLNFIPFLQHLSSLQLTYKVIFEVYHSYYITHILINRYSHNFRRNITSTINRNISADSTRVSAGPLFTLTSNMAEGPSSAVANDYHRSFFK